MLQKFGIETPAGVMTCHVARPQGHGSWPAVILYADALGVRRAKLLMAERLSRSGFYVALPDLYHRHGEWAAFDPATVFSGGPERQRLTSMYESVTPDTLQRDTAALLEHLGRIAEVQGDAVGVVGYCMGGRCALLAAGQFPDRVVAAASFHGGRLATDEPGSPHLLAPRMRAKLHVGVAGIDPGFTPEERQRLEAALTAAHVDHQIEVYEGVKHGWAVPDLPVFDSPAAERHWDRMRDLFDDTLRPGLLRLRPE